MQFIIRKLLSTFVSTLTTAALFAFFGVVTSDETHLLENQFVGWLLVFTIYIGLVVLVYGNLVSVTVEYLQGKWFSHDWLYVLLLGVFGLLNGVFFQEGVLALYGMGVALFYGVIDKWIARRNTLDKTVIPFLLVPIVLVIVSWGYLFVSSEALPPFTKEDAVAFATSGEGSTIEQFPSSIGTWEGEIDGMHVIRETAVKEVGSEIYTVTFTETWTSGRQSSGSWSMSYRVERGAMTLLGETGDLPADDK